jgi:hypothetical protein
VMTTTTPLREALPLECGGIALFQDEEVLSSVSGHVQDLDEMGERIKGVWVLLSETIRSHNLLQIFSLRIWPDWGLIPCSLIIYQVLYH